MEVVASENKGRKKVFSVLFEDEVLLLLQGWCICSVFTNRRFKAKNLKPSLQFFENFDVFRQFIYVLNHSEIFLVSRYFSVNWRNEPTKTYLTGFPVINSFLTFLKLVEIRSFTITLPYVCFPLRNASSRAIWVSSIWQSNQRVFQIFLDLFTVQIIDYYLTCISYMSIFSKFACIEILLLSLKYFKHTYSKRRKRRKFKRLKKKLGLTFKTTLMSSFSNLGNNA